MSKIPLSVAVITMNEAENISGCLGSVSFAGQIVVVDSGSTDDTVRIATAYGGEVFTETWKGFGPQKQSAVDKCVHPWVLILDADEKLSREAVEEIRRIVSSPGNGVAGYSFPRKNFFQGRWIRHMGWWPDRVVRLFRKDLGRISQAMVHEAVVVEGPISALNGPIEHFTESRLSRVLMKIDRYSTLGAQKAFDEGKSSGMLGAVLRAEMTFIQSYFLRLGILDGRQGLTLSVLDAINKFFKYAKLNELCKKNRTKTET